VSQDTLKWIYSEISTFYFITTKRFFHHKTLKYGRPLSFGNTLQRKIPEWGFPLASLKQYQTLFGTASCFTNAAKSLVTLNLSNNSLTVGIPSCIFSLSILSELNLSYNSFDMELSATLLFSDKLLTLDLHFNNLPNGIPCRIV
jgi:hypothetical protein